MKPIGFALVILEGGRSLKNQKNDTSKIDSIGFKTDTAENFFEKFAIISLSHPKPIGSALRVAGPKKHKIRRNKIKVFPQFGGARMGQIKLTLP